MDTDQSYYALTNEGLEHLDAQSLPDAIREGEHLLDLLGADWLEIGRMTLSESGRQRWCPLHTQY